MVSHLFKQTKRRVESHLKGDEIRNFRAPKIFYCMNPSGKGRRKSKSVERADDSSPWRPRHRDHVDHDTIGSNSTLHSCGSGMCWMDTKKKGTTFSCCVDIDDIRAQECCPSFMGNWNLLQLSEKILGDHAFCNDRKWKICYC